MNIHITELLLGEGPDSPGDGAIVYADVEVWKFNLGKSDNHYKGEKYAIQIVIFTVEANLQNF